MRMNKGVITGIFLLCAFLIIDCAVPPASPGDQASAELLLFNWEDYMPQSVLDAFTSEYGIRVKYLTYESMEEAVAQLRSGGVYDIVVIENNNIKPLRDEGLLVPLNYRNIPNFRNISHNFRDLAFDPGNAYSIPFDYGTTGLLVRDDLVKDVPISKWSDLWEPGFTGKVAARPLAYELIGISLKSLGYSLNSENPQQLEEALQRLIELKPALVLVDDASSDAVKILLGGEVSVMIGWGNDALLAYEENENISYVLPEEGTLLWGESFVIPAKSRNKAAAELFLNFILRPEVSAWIANEIGYATANQAAYPLIKPELIDNPIIFPSIEVVRKADWYEPLSPAGERLYADVWAEFMDAK